MNQQKNQEAAKPGFLEGLGSEVGAESAPLLEFITKYAWAIAGCVILLLLILGGMGLWNWHQESKSAAARDELARIGATMDGEAREGALRSLAESAPEGMKLYVYLTLGQTACENGHPEVAAEAYARVAAIDEEGALGFAAKLGRAGSLLEKGDARAALAILQPLADGPWDAATSPRLKEMLAEAAEKAGDPALAIKTYQELGSQIAAPEGGYYRARAEEIEDAQAKAGK